MANDKKLETFKTGEEPLFEYDNDTHVLRIFSRNVRTAVCVNADYAANKINMFDDPDKFASMLRDPYIWWTAARQYWQIKRATSFVIRPYLRRLEQLTGFRFPYGEYRLWGPKLDYRLLNAQLSMCIEADKEHLVADGYLPVYTTAFEAEEEDYQKLAAEALLRMFGDEKLTAQYERLNNGLFRENHSHKRTLLSEFPEFPQYNHERLWRSVVLLWLSQFAEEEVRTLLLKISPEYPQGFPKAPEDSCLLCLNFPLPGQTVRASYSLSNLLLQDGEQVTKLTSEAAVALLHSAGQPR